MLKARRKGDYLSAVLLSPEDDRALRRAFGRFGTTEGRAAGAAIVQRFQHKGPGNWIACDCLNGIEDAPAGAHTGTGELHSASHGSALAGARRAL